MLEEIFGPFEDDGELVIPLPLEMRLSLNWDATTELEWTLIDENTVLITRKNHQVQPNVM